MTYARVTTDDIQGKIRVYTGDGDLTNDPLDTFGSRAVVNISNLQALMKYVYLNGFEHHVAITTNRVSEIMKESLGASLKWEVYHHA